MEFVSDLLRLLSESSCYFTLCTDLNGNFSYVNQTCARAFAHVPSLIGRHYTEVMHPDDAILCREAEADCFAAPGRQFNISIRYKDGNGGYIIIHWEFKAIVDERGQPAGIFCLGYNTTHHTQSRWLLHETLLVLDRKRNLISQMAYQQSATLRKPIAEIVGLIQILKGLEASAEVKDICTLLEQKSVALDDTVKDMVQKAIS